jgi:hypothetical protein
LEVMIFILYCKISNLLLAYVDLSITCINILLYCHIVHVTIDGDGIGDSVCWPLIHTTHNYK